MTRNGKIARLPRELRHELNVRLADGEPQKQLVAWLNGHSEVLGVLDLYFNARPVTENNLSEWKQGGYQDWLRHQDSLELARLTADEAAELQGDEDCTPLSDRVSALMVAELMRLLRIAAGADTRNSPEARREVLEIARELNVLRVSDHRAARLRMDQRRWVEEEADLDKKALHRKLWDNLKSLQQHLHHEACVDALTENMTPEQEHQLRRHLRAGPRRQPRGIPSAAPAPDLPVSPANPTESGLPLPLPAIPCPSHGGQLHLTPRLSAPPHTRKRLDWTRCPVLSRVRPP